MAVSNTPAILLLTTPPAPDIERLRGMDAEAIVLAGTDASRHVRHVARVRPDLPLVIAADLDEAGARRLLAEADAVVPLRATAGEIAEAVEAARARRAEQGRAAAAAHADGSAPVLPQQLQAIGRLAGGLGHEFNNLLLVIDGSADLLRQHLPGDERLHAAFEQINDACRRAATLTRQLLAFGRQQALLAAPVDPNAVVSDLLPALRGVAGPHVDLVVTLGPDVPQIRVDAAQLRDVLSNLAATARHSMPEGGILTIETDTCQMTDADRKARPWLRPGEYVRICVSDTGPGIEPETLPHLFDPFFLPEGITRGGGLTLSSVYGVVKQSGGYIWAESRMHEGTSVTILLPPLAAPELPVTFRDRVRQAVSVRVLLVEDLESVREVLSNLLELRGFQVLAAGSAEEALALARTEPFDILLTDVTLPGLTGPELAREIARDFPDTPVLFMSGHPANAMDPSDLHDPRAFLQKPFSANALVERLHDLLGRTTEE